MSLVKVVPPGSWQFLEPMSRLVDVHSHGVDSSWLRKTAAAGVFSTLDIRPEPGSAYIHVIAMGDSDFYGGNRNGDLFYKTACEIHIPRPAVKAAEVYRVRAGNVERHHTFEKCAKVYRDHVNKDPRKAHGTVVKSAHNDAVSRVELMLKVPEDSWRDELQKLASGEDVGFSMACKLPYDVCSYCGNRAASRAEYCDDLRNHMTEITKEGHFIGAINDNMTFFDISRVLKNADRIALGIMKAAEAARVVSGAELAERMLLFPPAEDGKLRVLRKLAELEKEIEGGALGNVNALTRGLPAGELSDDDLAQLGGDRDRLPDILGSLADAKIVLSLRDFLKLVMGAGYARVKDSVPGAAACLPGVFNKLLAQPGDFSDFELGKGTVSSVIRDMIERMIPQQSLAEEPVGRRVTITIIRGGAPAGLVEKRSSKATLVEEKLAEAYARYKVAFCERAARGDTLLTALAVLSHYTQC